MKHLFANIFTLKALISALGVAAVAALGAAGTAVFGMMNQLYTGTPSSRRGILCPSTVVSGDPLFVGNDPCVALDTYQSAVGGCTALFDGSFNLFVISRSANSPLVNTVLKPGDKIYASGGTRDATTNVLSGFTLDGNSSGLFFGVLDPSQTAMTSGAGATVGVKIDG